MLAQLKRTHIGDNRPTIRRRDVGPVGRHPAEAVGDDIVNMPVGDAA